MEAWKMLRLILLLTLTVIVGAAWMLSSQGSHYYDEYSIRYDTLVSAPKLREAVGEDILLPDISGNEIETFEASVGYGVETGRSDNFVVLEAYYIFPDKTRCELKIDAKKGRYFVTTTADLSAPPEAIHSKDAALYYTLQNSGGLSRCDVYFSRDEVLYHVAMSGRGERAEDLLEQVLARLALPQIAAHAKP